MEVKFSDLYNQFSKSISVYPAPLVQFRLSIWPVSLAKASIVCSVGYLDFIYIN